MIDPDDIAPIVLAQALLEMSRVAKRFAEPHSVFDAWFDRVWVCLRYQQMPGQSIENVMVLIAKNITAQCLCDL